jgi:hypothetical protein
MKNKVKEIADLLDGNEYGEEIPAQDERYAKENGVIIVFGASDDLMEFRGAIHDEVGCSAGGKAYFDKNGLIENECENEDCPYFREKLLHAKIITAIWDSEGFSWMYTTNIPHETFEILEDKMKYCRGIVFSVEDLK